MHFLEMRKICLKFAIREREERLASVHKIAEKARKEEETELKRYSLPKTEGETESEEASFRIFLCGRLLLLFLVQLN
jgi:hypothetical protein